METSSNETLKKKVSLMTNGIKFSDNKALFPIYPHFGESLFDGTAMEKYFLAGNNFFVNDVKIEIIERSSFKQLSENFASKFEVSGSATYSGAVFSGSGSVEFGLNTQEK